MIFEVNCYSLSLYILEIKFVMTYRMTRMMAAILYDSMTVSTLPQGGGDLFSILNIVMILVLCVLLFK